MSTRLKRELKPTVLIIFGILIVLLFGTYIAFRITMKSGIPYDPADEGYCETLGVIIDSSHVDAVYQHPETILADSETFLGSDIASLMLANRHVETNSPWDVESWINQVRKIAALPMDERKQQYPYKLSREIIVGKETFCKIAVPHILSYLPGGADINTTFYLTALDSINSGFHNDRGGIVVLVSHPLYVNSERLMNQGSSSMYNIMSHELFHRAYRDAWIWQAEKPLENGALREFVRGLQNEGMAVNAAYRLIEYYPTNLSAEYPLHVFQPYVRYWVGRANKIFENAEEKSTEELWLEVYDFPIHGKYVLGGYMAGKIEDGLGRKALAETVAMGPISFIQTYNSVVEDGMEIHFTEPEKQVASSYQALRAAALGNDLDLVNEYLAAIQANPGSQLDIEVEGYLLYTTGYILLKNGYLDLAEDVFLLDIALFPQVSSIYAGLGDVRVKQGELSDAIQKYNRALELNERNLWVKIILAELNDIEE